MNAAGKKLGIPEMRDMDFVITTRELAKWAKEAGIDLECLEDSSYDRLMGEASGAGVIFRQYRRCDGGCAAHRLCLYHRGAAP